MKRILIVDDEEDFCGFTKWSLEALGDFKVSVCSNSAAAIGRVKAFQPDLILLDIMMPGMDGCDIAEKLQDSSKTQDIPIVFITALVTEQEARENQGIIAGRCFVPKPVELSKLIKTIEQTLES